MSAQYLEVEEGGKSWKVDLSSPSTVIGRHPTCAVVITDNRSSRNHCAVEKTENGFIIRDLASRNGTALNGKMVQASVGLRSGDVIQIGGARIKFVDPSAKPALPEEDVDDSIPNFAPDEDEAIEVLSEDDVIEVSEDDLIDESGKITTGPSTPTNRAVPIQKMSSNPEEAMVALSESLPHSNVTEKDILLLNSRGQLMHTAAKGVRKGPREPIDIFRLLLLVCMRSRTTDIHVEPHQDGYAIRVRVDGVMVDVAKFPTPFGVKLATLVKVLSDIDIAQRNTIQEGRFSSQAPSKRAGGKPRRIDYRVSFAPAVYGQKLVIRILDEENAPVNLADLYLPKWMLKELVDQVRMDSGMVLVTGPTGSGKTTTLYSLLRSIELEQRNAVTIEDPVEMEIERTTQIPVDDANGKSFGTILRSVLRQDPDIIMLGEIRDAETARTAMQAAITGHMVLSTVHTRNTLDTVFRLLDLGVEPFLVSQGLNVVIAQRLVRQLCQHCKWKVPATDEQKKILQAAKAETTHVFVPRGCPKCLGTGHAGRRGVFELLRVNSEMKELILQTPSVAAFEKTLEGTPFTTLAQSAMRLVAEGVASFEEAEKIAEKDGKGRIKGI